jgi:hypothetical protein
MMALLWAAALSTAAAGELSVGAFTTLNDPFLRTRGLAGGVQLPLMAGSVAPPVHLGVRGSWSPRLRDDDWTPLTTQLVTENSVSPDISRLSWTAMLVGEVPLFRSPHPEGHVDLRLHGGLGWVSTVDDLDALQAVGEERAESTQFQRHTASLYGLSTVVQPSRGPGLRVCVEWVDYVETVNATTLEVKGLLRVGLEAQLVFGSSESWPDQEEVP